MWYTSLEQKKFADREEMLMEWFEELLTNPFLMAGVLSWFMAQVVKTIIHAFINKRIVWERLVGDGGMPSGHSATVTALATMSLLVYGPGSYQFAVAALFAIVVCHDAMGVRREAGKQAVVLNELIRSFEEILTSEALPEVKLKEFVGHTPIQVIAGIFIGAINAVIMYFVWLV